VESVNANVVEPAALVAVIVYGVAADGAVGVPLITPLVASIASPAGSAGATAYDATVPVTVGVSAVIAVPTVYDCGLAYVKPLGGAVAGAFTVMLSGNVVLPPALLAVIVYAAVAAAALGVPLIAPVPASMLKPAGSAGLTE
jgi:hypothetical protein